MNVLLPLLLLGTPVPFEEHHILDVKPTGMNDRAKLLTTIPWCKGKFDGEEGWSEGRLSRSLQSSTQVQGLIQLCELPDDLTWRKNATAVVQMYMNYNNCSQDAALAMIEKDIAKWRADKANEGKEPSDEDRFAFSESALTVVEPEPGVEVVKPGKMAWCEGFTPSEKWDSNRISRTVNSQYGIQGTIDGARQLCVRPNDASWQKEGAYVLQKWMNWTHQTKAEAEKSLIARTRSEKFEKEQTALCKALEGSEEVSGGDKVFQTAQRYALGCENKGQSLWQDRSGFWDDIAYYFDPNTNPPNELLRLAHLVLRTEAPGEGKELPAKNADDNRGLVLYAVAAQDVEKLDKAALDKMLSVPPYNEYARIVAGETYAWIKARGKTYEAAIDKMVKGDQDHADILRKAPKQGWAEWEKVSGQWKAEVARSNAFEQKLFGPSRKALKGCMAELWPDIAKLVKSYKKNDFQELRTTISTDPIAMLLMSRAALCAGYEKVYGLPGVLKDLVEHGRDLRGPRSMAYYAVLDAISEAKKDRPKLALSMPQFALGSQSISTFAKDFDMSGGLPYDVDKSQPQGVVASLAKLPEGVEIKFKKSKYTYPEQECRDDKSHPLKIESDGTIRYYQNCKYTGKMVTVDTTPRPIVVAPINAVGIKAGTFVVGQEYSARAKNGTFMGIVHFTKSSPKDKKIQSLYGIDL